MDQSQQKDRAEFIQARKKLSRDWLRDSFYPEWETGYQNYKAQPDIKLDQDGKEDPELTNLSSPITFASSRRTVARMTAQVPHFKFRSAEKSVIPGAAAPITLAELIGRTMMYQWDRSKMQRTQKKHALQAVLFGWSPRLWYWSREIHQRRKRVNVEQAALDPATLQQIGATYGIKPEVLEQIAQAGPEALMNLLSALLSKHGRGGLLPIEYDYLFYEGPKADFTFVGDCYPEPHFQSMRQAKWFIVNQRRDFTWLQLMRDAYQEELSDGIEKLLEAHPKGTGRRFDTLSTDDDDELFRNMLSSLRRSTVFDNSDVQPQNEYEGEWLITEHHCPASGRHEAYIEYAHDGIYLGRIPYPYDLAGRVAITDCVLIDDLVSGIGDSTARIMRGLHKVHSDQLGYRGDLLKNILRPLIGTNSRELMENPESVKKMHGFRMFYVRDPSQLWQQQELAALAAAQAGIAEDSSILQQYFMFSGENAMSTMASVDPAQTRTAAGVNYIANQLDVLTKDLLDAFLHSSLNEDAEIMWLLNRSELAEGMAFDSSQYNRAFLYQEEQWKENWVRAEPLHFQVDGEITVQPGSTLAEDEVANQETSKYLMELAVNLPDLFSREKARDEVLIAHGMRHDMQSWIPKPSPPPEKEIKESANLSIKYEDLETSVKMVVLENISMFKMPEGAPPMPPEELAPAEQPEEQGMPA